MLSAVAVTAAKAREKAYKLRDTKALYLLVHPNGGRYWRLDYRYTGKRRTLALGTYPDVSLGAARKRRDKVRALLTEGLDPAAQRKAEKQAGAGTFEAMAREWHGMKAPKWSETTRRQILARLEQNVFPWIGSRPIAEIEPPELLAVLRRVEARGAKETAHRVLQVCGQVLRFAVASGRAARNPAVNLKGALAAVVPGHYPAILDPKEVGGLLRAIDDYVGDAVTRAALKLTPLVLLHPGELRRGEWCEIDGDLWRLGAERMKSRREHLVPLSQQAQAILEELCPLTSRHRLIFPGQRDADRPMSENTINAALRRMGYPKDVMTGHGFRSMASTLLNEQGWNPDAIERQLAHAPRDRVRGIYNRSALLDERRRMLQAWADYLDGLRDGAEVVPLRWKDVS